MECPNLIWAEGRKLWTVVLPNHNNNLKEAIMKILEKAKKRTSKEAKETDLEGVCIKAKERLKDLEEYKKGYGDPTGHKTMIITLEYLRRKGIQY